MLFENKYFLKLYRKLEDGMNPDVEITRFLTERANFPNVPAFQGALEYRRAKSQSKVVCLLQSAVAAQGDAWTLTLDAVGPLLRARACAQSRSAGRDRAAGRDAG